MASVASILSKAQCEVINTYDTCLLPQSIELYDAGGSFTFQQDNAPCHTSKVVKAFFQSKGIRVLDWSSNSSDMNPIQTLWAVLKNRLHQSIFTSKSELMNRILTLTTRAGGIE